MNVAQHKIVDLLKMLGNSFVITCHDVFHVSPKTTLLLPVWPRDAKRWDTPVLKLPCANHLTLFVCTRVCV